MVNRNVHMSLKCGGYLVPSWPDPEELGVSTTGLKLQGRAVIRCMSTLDSAVSSATEACSAVICPLDDKFIRWRDPEATSLVSQSDLILACKALIVLNGCSKFSQRVDWIDMGVWRQEGWAFLP